MFVAGARGIRSFTVMGNDGEFAPTGDYLRLKGSDQTLFGSVLTMSRAFGNLLSWLTQDMDGVWNARHRAWKLDEALAAAARGCATNPAHDHGMDRRQSPRRSAGHGSSSRAGARTSSWPA